MTARVAKPTTCRYVDSGIRPQEIRDGLAAALPTGNVDGAALQAAIDRL